MTTVQERPGSTVATATWRRGTGRLPVVGLHVSWRGLGVLAALVLVTAGLAVVALGHGDYPLSPSAVVRAMVSDQGIATTIVRDWRMPRVLACVVFGAALGAAGAVFQSVTRNPLGSPDVLGLSTGAYTGVLVVSTVAGAGVLGTSGGALLGGLLTGAAMYGLAYRGGVDGFRLVIVGIALSAALNAVNVYLQLRAGNDVALAAAIWGAGSVSEVAWSNLTPALVALVILLVPGLLFAPRMRQLELGDDAARAHGVGVESTRLSLILVAVALVSVVTAVAGPVMFVSLTAPQIARRLAGCAGIPVGGSAVTGALLLLGADQLAQRVVSTDLPAGVVTVVVGGTYLLLLLIHEARHHA